MNSVQRPAIQKRPIALVASMTAEPALEANQTVMFGTVAYLLWTLAWYSVLHDGLHCLH